MIESSQVRQVDQVRRPTPTPQRAPASFDVVFAETLRLNPGMREGLLRAHTPDLTGHCKVCRGGGFGSGGVLGCTLYRATVRASAVGWAA